MKLMIILMAALLAGAHVSVHAQALPGKATGKAQVKPAHREIRVLARNIAAEVRAPLTQAELDVAARVHVGTLPCELGQTVVLVPDAAQPGPQRSGCSIQSECANHGRRLNTRDCAPFF
jgi:hypothetical protein